MRVLHIVSTFARAEDDTQVPWLVELVHRLHARGIECAVLAPAYKGLRDHSIAGIPVYRFRYAPARLETLTHESGAPNRLKKNPLLFLLVVPYLIAGIARAGVLNRSHRFDVIHVHWPLPHMVFGMVARGRARTRLVATFYGAEIRFARWLPLMTSVLRWLMRPSDALIAIAPFVAREVEQTLGRRAHVIPYWSRVPTAAAPRAREHTTHELLAVGRLIERKGYEYLLCALSLIPAPLDARLTIVGRGQERARLDALCDELGITARVRWSADLSDKALARLYDECRVFVHPSIVDRGGDTESVGIVLLEAMSHACPIVATRVGGIPDVIEDGVTGLLVAEKDPRALANAITRLLTDTDLAQRLGAAAYRRAQALMNWDQSVDALLRVYAGEEP